MSRALGRLPGAGSGRQAETRKGYGGRIGSKVDHSATWPYEDGEPGLFSYARADHPTGVAAEDALGALDGGDALLYPSGMGAVTTVLLTMLAAGQTVAVAEGSYYGHRVLCEHLAPWGLRFVEFDQTGPPPPGADLVLIEAPSNPLLTMPDFAAAAAHPAPVVCDATVASPLRLRPLDQGCDVALHSATKVIGGHDDLLAGVTVTRDAGLRDRLHTTRRLTGMFTSAHTAWLLLRGLPTLELRLARQEETARALAARLAQHPSVREVRYPGFSFLISFDVVDADAAGRLERALGLIVNATSLGGVRSKLEARRRWEGSRVPAGLLRLSVGLESAEALWTDLEQALAEA